MTNPLAIDLYCGLGGWTDGLLAEGYDVVGFDIERHVYGEHCYPAQMVVQDVLTLIGSQFKDADLIVASPPCQEYSYMAMPWGRAKQIDRALRGIGEFPEGYKGSRTVADLNRLFDACFRIQREACEAAGRQIPMVVENVKGAQKWVGGARWNFGSYYLWGDVPALMPIIPSRAVMKQGIAHRSGETNFHGHTKNPGFRFDGNGKSSQTESVKNNGGSWFAVAHNTASGKGNNPVHALTGNKHKDQDGYERNHPQAFGWKKPRTSSKSSARKFASAMIAKIPLPLARHIGVVFKPNKTISAS